ncbi:MAG: DUF2254 domain-containing protein [Chloroflexi bacterium]|nr:DUF2254 domain-containing protein [Chloroflexota bacterium]
MRTRRRHYWTLLRESFWFVPGLMVVGSIALAVILLTADASLVGQLPEWMYAGGAGGARALLATIAGSMVTVAALGFSITIIALVLASTQFGPRLLTLFMRDVTSQWTLGMFAGTFAYCILVLRSIRDPGESGPPFIPELSITVAIALTLLSVGALILFFHHVAVSIQAPKVVSVVARDLDRAIERLYPAALGIGGPPPPPEAIPSSDRDAVITASADGYVQVVDDAVLLDLATGHDLTVRLVIRPGLFVVRGNPVLIARPADRVDRLVEDRLRATLIVGDVRTAEDDIEFSVRQLVEVALRALSPAINDPFTAMAAIDWLGAALARLAVAELPSRYRYDDGGTLRVIADISTFGGIVHTIFSRIRHYGATSPVVLNRLLEAAVAFGPRVEDEADRELVRAECEAVRRAGRSLLQSETDVAELEKRYDAAAAALRR